MELFLVGIALGYWLCVAVLQWLDAHEPVVGRITIQDDSQRGTF